MDFIVGSIIKFRTWEDTVLVGEIKRIENTTSGVKIQVVSGNVSRRIDTEQVIEVVKKIGDHS